MNKEPTYQQRKNIQQAYLKDKISIEKQIVELILAGFDELTAEYVVNKVIKEYKQELYEEAKEKEINEEHKNISYYVIVFTTALGPLFGIENIIWYLLAIAIAGVAGNYGFKDKPLAGIVGGIVPVILFPLIFKIYLGGKSNYIVIELILPLIGSLIIAYLIQFVISKIMYPEYED
jgi:hypothetical protein